MNEDIGETADPDYWAEGVRIWTDAVRAGDDDLARHARAELLRRAVDPATAVAAWCIPQGHASWQLIVLTPEGRFFELYVYLPPRPPRAAGWRDVTGHRFGFPAALEAARRVQRQEGPPADGG